MTSFYTPSELEEIGFSSVGKNVLISRKSSFYSPSAISIGDNVRIDDFCILSGILEIGSNIHISAYCALYGAKKIVLKDNCGLSPRVTVFSAMDDFGGDYLIGSVHPQEKTNVTGGAVIFESYVQIGCGCTVFPKVVVAEGTVVGAMSLVNKSLDEWGIYVGVPAKRVRERSRNLLNL